MIDEPLAPIGKVSTRSTVTYAFKVLVTSGSPREKVAAELEKGLLDRLGDLASLVEL